MEKKLRVMDSSGDSRITFNPAEAEAKATLEARALFDRMQAGGGAVFAYDKTGEPTRVKDFNDLAEDNIVVPRIVSG